MNRKSKIIISITGIVLVTLILVSLTYAYFLTRIQGNTNTRSISITTADLQLVYLDGNGLITAEKIIPGTTIDSKTFSVTNTGNVGVTYGVYIEDIINEFVRTSDLEIELSCTSNVNNRTCDGVTTTFPENNTKIVSNEILNGETQTYSLTLTYKEAGVDQSVDMNKNLSGKVNIYGSERVTLEFDIANSATGDYGVLHSEPKTSYATIENGTGSYRFVGVEFGSHTITIYNANNEEIGSNNITITPSNNTNVTSLENITIPNEIEELVIPATITNETFELGSVKLYEENNPYPIGTLAQRIIHNAQFVTEEEKALGYAEFRRTPITKPGQSRNKLNYETYGNESSSDTNIPITPVQQGYYWTYSTNYTIDKNTGNYSLVNPQKCKYSDEGCIRDLISNGEEVYIYPNNNTSNANDFTNSNNALKTSSGKYNIYKIITAPEVDSENNITLVTHKISNIPYSVENILSITEDDYGNSYYFRGDVKNNYLNFNNMCWRIVRIEGDGSVKLILASSLGECSNESLTDDSAFIGTGQIYYEDADNYSNTQKYIMKNWYTNNISAENDLKVKSEYACIGDTTIKYRSNGTLYTNYISGDYYFDNYVRMTQGNISLKCVNNSIKAEKIYPITSDEVMFAGASIRDKNYVYYLINNTNSAWWTINISWVYSPNRCGTIISTGGMLNVLSNTAMMPGMGANVNWGNAKIRPLISLKSEIEISSGNGSLEHPYEVE